MIQISNISLQNDTEDIKYSSFHTGQDNDNVVFTNIYNMYHHYLVGIAFNYLKSEEDAKDVVQDTFIQFWEHRDNTVYGNNVIGFLYTILKNLTLSRLRRDTTKINKYKDYNAMCMIEMSSSEVAVRNAHSDLILKVNKAINNLPSRQKDVCHLKVTTELSNQEIADRMGISTHTVKTHYTQAVIRLRTYFEDVSRCLNE